MRRDRGFTGARRFLLVALPALAFAAACRRSAPDAADNSASASARHESAPKSAVASARPSAGIPAPARPKAPCRVTTGSGSLEAPKEPIGPRSELYGTRFVELAADERISLRHERTQRELTLLGPGRFLPCARGDEQVLVLQGGVKSTPGVGAHAGGEVVLATPFGLVRYADAGLHLQVSPARLALGVNTGEAQFDPPPRDAAVEAKPKSVRGPNGKLDVTKAARAEVAVERCRSAEASSRALEKPPRPAGSARAALGTWAVASFEARRAARLACALSRVVIESRPEPERRRLEDLLASRESDPKAAPLPAPAQKK